MKNNLPEKLINEIIDHFYVNLTKQINENKHYNIYIQNIGQLHLSPKKIQYTLKYSTSNQEIDKIPILENMLKLSKDRIQERIDKHNEKIKLRKELKIKNGENK